MKLSERAFDLRDRMLLWVRSDSAAMKELADIADEIAALEGRCEAALDRLDESLAAQREQDSKSRAGVTLTGAMLSSAWKKYVYWFGELPHGTEKQMDALLELTGMERTKAEGEAGTEGR